MFGRSVSASGKNADADLYDIFGAPMASKAVGLGPGVISDPFRPNSPSGGRQSFSRPGKSSSRLALTPTVQVTVCILTW